ncbi:MAG: c-type cytochrome [Hyphomicrobiaceae bacterium]|nr:c-type cytochrome [Hyphomicrobiaceae bacterium]
MTSVARLLALLASVLGAAATGIGPAMAGTGGTVDGPAATPPGASGHGPTTAGPNASGVAPDVPARRAASGTLAGHGGPVKAIRVDRNADRVLTGSFDYTLMVWDVSVDPARPLHRLADHAGAVNAVALTPDGTRALAAGDDGSLTVSDIASGKLVHRFTGHGAKVVDLAISSDGGFAVTASWDRTARIWNLRALTEGPVLEGHRGPVNAVAVSTDGTAVYTASADGEIRRFQAADGRLDRSVHRHGWGINVMVLLPDGAHLAFGALNGTAAVIDTASGDAMAELGPAERPVLALATTERPGLIATASADGLVRVLRLADFALIEEYKNPYGPIWALDFSADGTALYLGGLDDFVTRWQVSPRQSRETIASPFPRRFQLAGDPDDELEQGRIQFSRKCSVCHTLAGDGKNRAGPSLEGVFGRRIGTVAGYPYSAALKRLDIVWDATTIGKLFELGPDAFTPGSKMPLQKMTDKRARDALIAYLKIMTAGAPADGSGAQPGAQQGVPVPAGSELNDVPPARGAASQPHGQPHGVNAR